jgi:hypothetical protein
MTNGTEADGNKNEGEWKTDPVAAAPRGGHTVRHFTAAGQGQPVPRPTSPRTEVEEQPQHQRTGSNPPVGPRSLTRSYFTEIPWQLHAKPTTLVTLAAMVVTMIATYVLNHHVLGTKDHVGVFLVGSYVIFSSYFLFYFVLDNYSTSFKSISQDKKFYTISNLIKAGVLAAVTPFVSVELFNVVVYDSWNGNQLRNLGCIYAIPDFVSLLLVRRMSYTTIFHHICVCIFNYFSIQNDYSEENVVRLIAVYAAFSTFAYCVNMLLASRFLGVNPSVVRLLSIGALLVYVACCAVNWTWQVAYLRRLIGGPNDHWTIYVYMLLISFVMWDDIVLMRWLRQNVQKSPLAKKRN